MRHYLTKVIKNRWLMVIGLSFIICQLSFSPARAQKFALVDMDYIFKNIPAYERANEQLSQISKKWQAEVDAIQIEAQTLYKNYQNEVVFLSQEQKKARQDAIMEKEKEAAELKKKYFGPQSTHVTHPGGGVQCRQGHCRPSWLSAHPRPCQRHRHHLRLAQD